MVRVKQRSRKDEEADRREKKKLVDRRKKARAKTAALQEQLAKTFDRPPQIVRTTSSGNSKKKGKAYSQPLPLNTQKEYRNRKAVLEAQKLAYRNRKASSAVAQDFTDNLFTQYWSFLEYSGDESDEESSDEEIGSDDERMLDDIFDDDDEESQPEKIDEDLLDRVRYTIDRLRRQSNIKLEKKIDEIERMVEEGRDIDAIRSFAMGHWVGHLPSGHLGTDERR